MTQSQGFLRKMATELSEPVQYSLVLGEQLVPLNEWVGKQVRLKFTGNIECVACHKAIKKSYQRGYCYPCTQRLASCDMCILKPEKCHYDRGTCREPLWGQTHCMQPHIVYLANSSGIKVGITRESQVPTRWIDQGAIQALPIFRVQTRYQSGLIEVYLSQHLADKTNWRKMLQGQVEKQDLNLKRDELLPEIAAGIQEIAGQFDFGAIEMLTAEEVVEISYPVEVHPEKVKSLNFDKVPEIEATLQGIKGQYLLFDTGVINIRNFGGYEVEFSAN